MFLHGLAAKSAHPAATSPLSAIGMAGLSEDTMGTFIHSRHRHRRRYSRRDVEQCSIFVLLAVSFVSISALISILVALNNRSDIDRGTHRESATFSPPEIVTTWTNGKVLLRDVNCERHKLIPCALAVGSWF